MAYKEYREPRKKSFRLYYDNELNALGELSDEELGSYYRAIVMHEVYGQDIDIEDRTVRILANATARAMDRDLEQYRATCEKNKRNRSKQGESHQPSLAVTKGTNTDTDTDIDTDTDTEKEKGKENEEEIETDMVSLKGSSKKSTNCYDFNLLMKQLGEIYHNSPDTYYDLDAVYEILTLYLDMYQSVKGYPHNKISTDKLKKIIDSLRLITDNGEVVIDLCDIEPSEAVEIFTAIIEKHFQTEYDNCDYSIHHFMSGDIRKNRYYETVY